MTELCQEYADVLTKYGCTAVVKELNSTLLDCLTWEDLNLDRAQAIQTFLKEAACKWKASYVLLAGDESVVPARTIGGPALSQGVGGWTRYDPVSDFWYTRVGYNESLGECWAESWNANADSWIGEDADDVAYDASVEPGLFIGRLPARNAAELDVMLDKTYDYLFLSGTNSDPVDASFYEKAVVAAGPLWGLANTPENHTGQIQTMEHDVARDALGSASIPWSITRLYPRFDEPTFTAADSAECLCYDAAHDSLVTWYTPDSCAAPPCDPEFTYWARDTLATVLRGETHVLFHIEHSNPNRLGAPLVRGTNQYDPRPGHPCSPSSAQIDQCSSDLASAFASIDPLQQSVVSRFPKPMTYPNYSFILSSGSYTNWHGMDSISETFLRSRGGAVVYFGNENSSGGFLLDEMATMAKDVLNPGGITVGRGWFDALVASPASVVWRTASERPMMGDPLVWMWRGTPENLQIDVDPEPIVTTWPETYTVTVTDGNSQPVQDATVALYQPPFVYVKGMTDASGVVKFPHVAFVPQIGYPAHVSALRPGYKPRSREMSFGTVEGKQLKISSYEIDDCVSGGDCDGIVEAGDAVDFNVTLENTGADTVSAASVEVRATPSMKVSLRVNGEYRSTAVWIGTEVGNPPAESETFRVPVADTGVRTEGEPAPGAEEGFQIWRNESTGKYRIAVHSPSQSPDTIFTAVVTTDSEFADVVWRKTTGDATYESPDSLYFAFEGGAVQKFVEFNTKTTSWGAWTDSTETTSWIAPGDSTVVSFGFVVDGDVPPDIPLTFTVSAVDDSSKFYHNDLSLEAVRPRVRLRFGPSWTEPGDTTDVYLKWRALAYNSGSGEADSAAFVIRHNTGNYGVTDSLVWFTDLEPGESVEGDTLALHLASIADTVGATFDVFRSMAHHGIVIEEYERYCTFYEYLPGEDLCGGGGDGVPPPPPGGFPGPSTIQNLDYDLVDGGVRLQWEKVINSGSDAIVEHWIGHTHALELPFTTWDISPSAVSRYTMYEEVSGVPFNPSLRHYFAVVGVRRDLSTTDTLYVGPIWTWVEHRDGWPRFLDGLTTSAPSVFDFGDVGGGIGVVAGTDKVYAFNEDGSPVGLDSTGVLYDPSAYHGDLDLTAPAAFLGFSQGVAVGNWDDADTSRVFIAGSLFEHGVHSFEVADSIGALNVVDSWYQPENELHAPVVARIHGDAFVTFLPGRADTFLYAWDAADLSGYADSTGRFAAYPESSKTSATLAIGYDTDRDRYQLIAATQKGLLAAYDIDDTSGVRSPRWTVDLEGSATHSGWRLSYPAVGDIDGDDENEIVVTSFYDPEDPGTVYVVDENDGTTSHAASSSEWQFRTVERAVAPPGPTLADLDDDGDLEILVSSGRRTAASDTLEFGLVALDYDSVGDSLISESCYVRIPFEERPDDGVFAVGSAVVGEVDYDPSAGYRKRDVFVATNAGAIVGFEFDPMGSPSLQRKLGWPLLLHDVLREPALVEFDPENAPGEFSLVVVEESGFITVLDLPTNSTTSFAPDWPLSGGDVGNTRSRLSGAQPLTRMAHDTAGHVLMQRLSPLPVSDGQRIRLRIPERGVLELDLFDVTGRRVRQVFDGAVEPGVVELQWDGNDDRGHRLPSGVYWYRTRIGLYEESSRTVVIR